MQKIVCKNSPFCFTYKNTILFYLYINIYYIYIDIQTQTKSKKRFRDSIKEITTTKYYFNAGNRKIKSQK